ncbi:hypothetical protein ACFQ4J_06085 [Laceyella tengchongensis]
MKCLNDETMFAYVNQALPSEEMTRIHSHLNHCKKCRQLEEDCLRDNALFREAVSGPSLPDEFVSEVRREIESLKTHTPAKQTRVSFWRRHKKMIGRLAGVAVALLVAFPLTLWAAPSVATYLGIDLTDMGVIPPFDKSKNDYKRDYSVSDRGITLRVIEVVANRNEIVASYVIEKNGKTISPHQYQDKEKRIAFAQPFLVDEKGKRIMLSEEGGWKPENNHAFVAFRNLPKSLPKKIYLEFRPHAFNGMKGDWNLRIPINFEKTESITRAINQSYVTKDNMLSLKLNEITYTNTSTKLSLHVGLTPTAKATIEKQILKRGETLEGMYYFSILDEQGHALQLPDHISPRMKNRQWILTLTNSNNKEEPETLELPPFPKGKKHTIVFHSYHHAQESKQTIAYEDGKEISFKAGTASFNTTGTTLANCEPNVIGDVKRTNCYTINGVWKGSKTTMVDMWFDYPTYWKVVDETGKAYIARAFYQYENALNGKFSIIVQRMKHKPKRITLTPWVQKGQAINWRVELPVR